ncbi:hypothetical protein SAMN06265348_1251 [Pedobacter westerhofensis]|uniref:Uncharacterized protein n=1 Tax=Pedobacter westerhofensis TaxID=425512 RepID=A0A521FVP5_9SPHI|nr:hypothetical protein [Pedobacter westerhofensis]SMO99691.1 hypothetical protein SAMN06265348_1251 [Pedobacter westerhofensis]
MEELFTSKEISAILMEATNPVYQLDYLWHPTFSKLQIYSISKKGLIFIHGNKDTGMKHFEERHSITSRKLYEKEDGKFDNPTKFILAPIEYAKVADIIYTPSNLVVEKNNRPELFDVYDGDYHKEGKTYRYRLIVYKYTGIVHTFFLTNRKFFTKKEQLPLRQGWLSSKYNIMTCVSEYRFNYSNISDEIKFKVLLISNPFRKEELWGLEVYKDNEPFFTHIIKKDPISLQHDTAIRMMQLDFQDVSFIEIIIKEIIKNKYDFQDGYGSYWFYEYE